MGSLRRRSAKQGDGTAVGCNEAVSGLKPEGCGAKCPARGSEKGQAVALFAVLIPVTVLFFLGIIDYMITNARVMETVAAADLAAHAGAQYIDLLPDGTIEPRPAQANAVAASFFTAQAPPEAALGGVSCGLIQERPACRVSAQVRSAGWLLPETWIRVNTVGYLAYGVTEDDQ